MGVFGLLVFEFLLAIAIMTALWLVFKKTDKAQIVDVGWALCFFSAGCLLFLGIGDFSHQLVLFLMIAIWSLRLTYHLLTRFFEQTAEDLRYASVREQMGGDPEGVKFLMMFWFQGLVVSLLSIPFFASATVYREWSGFEVLGILLFWIGMMGETIADWQLKQFKSSSSGQKVLRSGLWAYSRHPNFFFEWVIWIGFALFVWTAPYGWTGVLSALAMLYLLLKVSGVPLMEKLALHQKGEEYRSYQNSVSLFIPWFPK